jgi:hypothetical protein
MIQLQVSAVVFAILSINARTETERVVFKVLALLCLLLPLFVSIVTHK